MKLLAKKPYRSILLSTLALIILGVGALLILHISNHSEKIYLESGVAFEAKDLAIALGLLALIIAPLLAASYADELFSTRTGWLAPIVSLCLLLLFPLSFKFILWYPATYADGKPIFNFNNERAKTVYASTGYRPLWKANFSSHQPYDSYADEDGGIRSLSRGNLLWGEYITYGLNRMGRLDAEGKDSNQVYECALMRTSHILGFYFRDRRGEELMYEPQSSLPSDQCRPIERPVSGS